MNGFIIFLLFVWIAYASYIVLVHRIHLHFAFGVLISPIIAFFWTAILDALFDIEAYLVFSILLVPTLIFACIQFDYNKERIAHDKEQQHKSDDLKTSEKPIVSLNSKPIIANATKFKVATSKPPLSPPKPNISSGNFSVAENKPSSSKNQNLKARKIEFLYENANGDIKWRTVRVISVDNRYLQAHCHDSHEERTFRLDRIIGDITIKGEKVPLMKWLAAYGIYSISGSHSNNSHSKIMPEICFTGFKSADKTRLELLALENGFTIRTSIAKNLDFLVYGSNAGPSKMNQAFERGIPCLTEDEFLEMLETGEVPE